MANLSKRLKAAQKNWKKGRKRAKDEGAGFAEFDDGRYIAKLVGAEIGESQSSGRLQVVWQWQFLEGDYAGQKKYDFDGIETEDNLMWLARKFARLGQEPPDDLTDLEEILKEIIATEIVARIRLKTKAGSDFQNLFIDKVLKGYDPDDADDDDDDDDDDDSSDSDSDDDDDDDSSDDDDDDDDDGDDDDDDDDDVPEKPRVKGKGKGKGKKKDR